LNPRSPGHNRRFVFWAFFGLFGGLTVLFLFGLGAIFWLLSGGNLPDMYHPVQGRVALGLCFIPLGFMLLAGFLGRTGFRRLGKPFAEIMSATEAVARGDLSVRLQENGPQPLRAMARSFNHMTAELARAEQQRRNMTADIAHELRTPLHIIQGNLEGMLDGVYEPNPENLSNTLDETHLLARLVADLQTLSLAEAGQLPLHPTRFPVADLLADIATSFSAQVAEQGVTLQVDAPDPAIELVADYDRLDQVLSNLVANALRFTSPAGKISLRAAANSGMVRITVSDNGTGIPAEDLPYIFDRFWKGARARTRDGTGSGLGLAIARQLIRAHNGTIDVTSQLGQGTTFTIELPLMQ
jgi:signal transduction histidine kinase